MEVSIGGHDVTLRFRDGVLGVAFHFDGGSYSGGCLMLDGSYPATITSVARGRKLSSLVDHPAFFASGVTASSATWEEDQLQISHHLRVIPIEHASDGMGQRLAA